jgi:undecaprenyl-diphosphatase
MILLDGNGQLDFLQQLLRFDYWLFAKINQQWTNTFLDAVLIHVREPEIWIPFYLFLLVFSTLNFGKKGWLWSFGLIMTGIISDLVSSSFIKHHILRLRPCNEPMIADTVRVLASYCPQSSSFTSSHACNHFAASMFIFLTMKKISPWWRLIFLWAIIICYAQVYVGVHYPLDILGGTIVGCILGYGTGVIFNKQAGTLSLQQ